MENGFSTIYKTKEELKEQFLALFQKELVLKPVIFENIKLDKIKLDDIDGTVDKTEDTLLQCLSDIDLYIVAIFSLVGREEIEKWVEEFFKYDKLEKSVLSDELDYYQALIDNRYQDEDTVELIKENLGLTIDEYLTVVDFFLKIKLALKD